MFSILAVIARSRVYWFLVLLLCLSLEGVALYYQYVLDYGPCVLCVQIRAWIAGLGVVAFLMWLIGYPLAFFGQLLSLLLSGGLFYASWITLGVERGTVEGSCTMDPHFPAWLPLHQWLPPLFKPTEPCGYTPLLPVGHISMAEALVVISAIWVLVSLLLLLGSMKGPGKRSGWK